MVVSSLISNGNLGSVDKRWILIWKTDEWLTVYNNGRHVYNKIIILYVYFSTVSTTDQKLHRGHHHRTNSSNKCEERQVEPVEIRVLETQEREVGPTTDRTLWSPFTSRRGSETVSRVDTSCDSSWVPGTHLVCLVTSTTSTTAMPQRTGRVRGPDMCVP